MAQELADHGEALAGGERAARVGVAEVVDAHVVEAGAGAEAVPLGGDGGEMGARLLADDDPGVVGTPRIPASTASAVGVSGTMRVPVLPSRSRNSPAVRSTSSQRSVRISFKRQPVSMRRRSAAMA